MRSTILIAACILAVIAADAGHAGAAHKAAAPAAHASASDAPEPLSDMGKKLLWVAFLGLAVPTAYFWQQTMAQADGKRKYHIITFGITAIASLAYLTMATGHGVYIRPFDGREFFYARYVDWAFTTPLQLLDILGFAGAGADVTSWLLGVDFLMIIAGLIGAFIDGNEKYYFWAFGMCMFAPILYALLVGLKASAANKSAACQAVFTKISLLTAISWAAYPVVWVLAEGQETLEPDQEAICYTILDIIAKSVFGFLIISARDACNEV